MSTATATSERLLTAEEFANRPDPGYPEELVRGRIVTTPPPNARHGQVCLKAGRLLGNYADEHNLGHVLSNDAGVITEHGPDSVRGPDISFYSYAKLPKGPLPQAYPEMPPDLVVEVRSHDDRWPKVLAKVAEYLTAGVAAVIVLDPEEGAAFVYEGDEAVRILREDDELALPEILGEFRVAVKRFFD
jgi:Uma2 family endonuclease